MVLLMKGTEKDVRGGEISSEDLLSIDVDDDTFLGVGADLIESVGGARGRNIDGGTEVTSEGRGSGEGTSLVDAPGIVTETGLLPVGLVSGGVFPVGGGGDAQSGVKGPLCTSVTIESALEDDDALRVLQNEGGAISPAIVVTIRQIEDKYREMNTHRCRRRCGRRD